MAAVCMVGLVGLGVDPPCADGIVRQGADPPPAAVKSKFVHHFGSASEADPPPRAAVAVIVDTDGKKYELAEIQWTAGVRRLTWLADPAQPGEDGRLGPLALEIREPNSTTLTKGVLTFVPLRSVERIEYDYDRQFVTYQLNGLQQTVLGTLQYRGINVIEVSGKTTGGEAVRFSGGTRGGKTPAIRTLTLARSVPHAVVGGVPWNVQIVQPSAKDPIVPARNLKPLIALPGGRQKLLEGLPLHKREPLVFTPQLNRFTLLANDPNTGFAVAEIAVAGQEERLIAIPLTVPVDGQSGTLLGLLGEIDAGWKLFPLHTIRTITPSKRKLD